MWKDLLKKAKLSENYVSVILGVLVVLVISVLLFNFFSAKNKPGSSEQNKTEENTEKTQNFPANHAVTEGETLWSIAEKYYQSGYSWTDLAKANNLENPDSIEVGTVLSIPKIETKISQEAAATNFTTETANTITGNSYTVVEGDSLWDISLKAYQDGYKWVEIAKANNLSDPNLIFSGNVLTLPR